MNKNKPNLVLIEAISSKDFYKTQHELSVCSDRPLTIPLLCKNCNAYYGSEVSFFDAYDKVLYCRKCRKEMQGRLSLCLLEGGEVSVSSNGELSLKNEHV